MNQIDINKTRQALENFQYLPNEAHTEAQVVAALYGCSLATVWRWVKSGHIPKPRRIGQRTTRWQVGELRAHLAGVAASDVGSNDLASCELRAGVAA